MGGEKKAEQCRERDRDEDLASQIEHGDDANYGKRGLFEPVGGDR